LEINGRSSSPAISVIMPVYNAAKFLRESVESILNQTEEDFELIIINDGSTDESEDIILSYDDPRIRYVKQENIGVAAAFNTGLDYAQGNFITFHGADDISLPVRLEVLKRHFASVLVGVVHSDMLLVNELNQPIGYWQSQNIEKALMLRFFLKVGTPFNNGSMMLRSEMLDGFLHDSSLKVGSDTDMVFRLTRDWDSVHITEPLYVYRRHSHSLTKQVEYEPLVAHMRKFLERHSLEELIPEIDWESDNRADNEAKASAIVGLFLFRRWMAPDGQVWLEKAKRLANSMDSKLFVNAMANLASGKYEIALQLFMACSIRDHIVENYIGETIAYMGDVDQAYKHFMRALEINPNYTEPVENLRGIGGLRSLNLLDNSWAKFK